MSLMYMRLGKFIVFRLIKNLKANQNSTEI